MKLTGNVVRTMWEHHRVTKTHFPREGGALTPLIQSRKTPTNTCMKWNLISLMIGSSKACIGLFIKKTDMNEIFSCGVFFLETSINSCDQSSGFFCFFPTVFHISLPFCHSLEGIGCSITINNTRSVDIVQCRICTIGLLKVWLLNDSWESNPKQFAESSQVFH